MFIFWFYLPCAFAYSSSYCYQKKNDVLLLSLNSLIRKQVLSSLSCRATFKVWLFSKKKKNLQPYTLPGSNPWPFTCSHVPRPLSHWGLIILNLVKAYINDLSPSAARQLCIAAAFFAEHHGNQEAKKHGRQALPAHWNLNSPWNSNSFFCHEFQNFWIFFFLHGSSQ